MKTFEISPIGTLHCPQYYRYQQPRQGSYATNYGQIVLEKGHNFEQALQDLDKFSHIWVVYLFHLNQTWRPLVNPPVNPDGKKKGLFATRSPHRPNRIGMSCVKLKSVDKTNLTVEIENFDLLDKTPIVDIKPYIVSADSHPEASLGWLPSELDYWQITYVEKAQKQMKWVFDQTGFDLNEFCEIQLSLDPINGQRKRVQQDGQSWRLAFRTWRILFTLDEEKRSISVDEVVSGYSSEELLEAQDTYKDKEIHRMFAKTLLWP